MDNSELRTTRLLAQFTNLAQATLDDPTWTPPAEQIRTELHHVIDDLPADATDNQVLTELDRRITDSAVCPRDTAGASR